MTRRPRGPESPLNWLRAGKSWFLTESLPSGSRYESARVPLGGTYLDGLPHWRRQCWRATSSPRPQGRSDKPPDAIRKSRSAARCGAGTETVVVLASADDLLLNDVVTIAVLAAVRHGHGGIATA